MKQNSEWWVVASTEFATKVAALVSNDVLTIIAYER